MVSWGLHSKRLQAVSHTADVHCLAVPKPEIKTLVMLITFEGSKSFVFHGPHLVCVCVSFSTLFFSDMVVSR